MLFNGEVYKLQATCVSVAVLLELIVTFKVTTESQPAVLVKVTVGVLVLEV